jgi:Txe/YoeB family toxin of Txe-Axe toxin-antitoxin module
MLQLTWTDTGLEDLAWWVENNPKVLKRIVKLCLKIHSERISFPCGGLASELRM